jgi:hypothetical protein
MRRPRLINMEAKRRQVNSVVLLFALSACCSPWVSGAPSAGNYLSRLQDTISQTRSNLLAITRSADQAARQFITRGNLWAAGRQLDFISEACGRAGGLMAIAPLNKQAPTNHDIVLYAVPGRINDEDSRIIEQFQKQGAMVVKFESSADLFDDHFPLDTVANVSHLWAWTGEFVAACTRLGKMPVLYQSYGLPGGIERGKRYQGRRFHDDLNIKPIAPGVLGKSYLSEVEDMLASIQETQMQKILQAARWWREVPATSALTLVTGHMFPRHGQDPRAPSFGEFAAASVWEHKNLSDAAHPPRFVLYVGYQFAPQELLDQARTGELKLVYFDVRPGQPPEPASNILYINPAWPLTDGCVTVPGYDIPILPASGVVQAAIYWAIASERAKAAL